MSEARQEIIQGRGDLTSRTSLPSAKTQLGSVTRFKRNHQLLPSSILYPNYFLYLDLSILSQRYRGLNPTGCFAAEHSRRRFFDTSLQDPGGLRYLRLRQRKTSLQFRTILPIYYASLITPTVHNADRHEQWSGSKQSVAYYSDLSKSQTTSSFYVLQGKASSPSVRCVKRRFIYKRGTMTHIGSCARGARVTS